MDERVANYLARNGKDAPLPRFLRVNFPGEWMWIAPTGPYTGTLENDPVFTDLRPGDEVTWRWRVNRKSRTRWRQWVLPSEELLSNADSKSGGEP